MSTFDNNNTPNTDSPLPAATTRKITDASADNKLPAPDTLQAPSSQTSPETLAAMDKAGHVGYLELLEERPVINKERLDVGKVTVSKHSRTKTINVPIELIEEYITVTAQYNDAESQDLLSGTFDDKDILRHVEPTLDSKAVVTVNGKQVEIGDAPIEIVLSRQVATITKETYAVQEVAVNKTTHTHTDSIQVELKHEELEVSEEGFLAHENTRTHQHRK